MTAVNRFLILASAVTVTLVLIGGCMTAATSGSHVDSQSAIVKSSTTNADGPEDQNRLARLLNERNTESLKSDYPLGPGDILEVSVPDIDELKHC